MFETVHPGHFHFSVLNLLSPFWQRGISKNTFRHSAPFLSYVCGKMSSPRELHPVPAAAHFSDPRFLLLRFSKQPQHRKARPRICIVSFLVPYGFIMSSHLQKVKGFLKPQEKLTQHLSEPTYANPPLLVGFPMTLRGSASSEPPPQWALGCGGFSA